MGSNLLWTVIASMLGVVGLVGSLALGIHAFSKPTKGRSPTLIEGASPEEITPEELLAVLERESEARARRRKNVNRVVFGYLGISLTLLLSMALIGVFTGQWKFLESFVSTVLSFASIFSLFAFYTANKNEKRAVQLAGNFDDVRFIGPLLEAVHFQDTKLRNLAVDRLTSLLPKLRASDGHLLTDAQRQCLYKLLISSVTPKVNPCYLCSAFGAIAHIGDEKALSFVDPFCGNRMVTIAGQEVFEAAFACRTALKERAEIDRRYSMLLRPAASASDPNVLLKPVGATTEVNEMQLLRATVQE